MQTTFEYLASWPRDHSGKSPLVLLSDLARKAHKAFSFFVSPENQPSSHLLKRHLSFKGFSIVLALACGAVSCATSGPIEKPITDGERVEKEKAFGAGLARDFEPQLKFRQDQEVLVYLRGLAEALAQVSPELKEAGVGIFVIKDRDQLWRDFALPGNRIYLSVGLLKTFEFENELAAAIALQFGHIIRHDVLQSMIRLADPGVQMAIKDYGPTHYPEIEGLLAVPDGQEKKVDYFSPKGVFAFPNEVYMNATEQAVGIMYRAGYDPRGLIAFWERHAQSKGHSPHDSELLAKLIEKTRRAIALYSPLRNPIVRSQAFLSVQKRIRKL